MEIVTQIVQIVFAVSASLAAFLSILIFIRLRWPSPAWWLMKLYVSAVSPFLFLTGISGFLVGVLTGSGIISLISMYVALIFALHIFQVTRPPHPSSGFERAFGAHWQDRITPMKKHYFLRGRSIFKLPAVPKPRMESNIPFATIPASDRKLLCDIWQPPENVTPSGLAFIYLHGGTWYLLDKDLGTRPLFSHLAAQGHVIMDVAYRLAFETDMMGMVYDVKRAIHWMKENGGIYGVSPHKIIAGGGSAGAHLALLAAFTAGNSRFTPKELHGKDLSVCGVISLYGPTDLMAMYYHTNQHLTTRSTPGTPKKSAPSQLPAWIIKAMGADYYRLGMDKGFENAGAFAPLLGGHPDECPERYTLFSPVTHVHPECPPTLLIHGEHDVLAPVQSTRYLYTRLQEEKNQSVLHIIPQADHAFDLQLPKLSPSAHSAFYDIERFLALMANSLYRQERKAIENKNLITRYV